MKRIKKFIPLIGISLLLFSCGNKSGNSSDESGGKKIGSQTWTTQNLDVSTFRNGEAIPEAKTYEEWTAAGEQGKPACCYYDNDTAYGKKYGRLYNWYAVNDPRGLAPKGWHIPSDQEWTTLTNFLGGQANGAAAKMKSDTGWEASRNGNNSSGFAALPAGVRNKYGSFSQGIFDKYGGEIGAWWSSTEVDRYNALCRSMHYTDVNVGRSSTGADKPMGFSVRCVKD